MNTYQAAIVNQVWDKEAVNVATTFVVEPQILIARDANACNIQMALDYPKEVKAKGNYIAVSDRTSWGLTAV